MKATSEEVIAISGATAVIVAVLGAGIGLTLALFGQDEVIRLHGLVFLVALAVGGYYVLTHPRQGGDGEQARYMDGPIKVATVAAVFWGIVGFLVGDLIAWQLAFPV